MHKRRKLAWSIALVLLLVAAMTPLAAQMAGELNAQKENDEQIAGMLQVHAEHLAAGFGEAVGALIDVEDAWAIEDTRRESETPLVTLMHNGEDELGFDAVSRTFYCTIGLGNEDWPEVCLTARGEEGVRVAWIDDYTYDWCSDALSEGYRYELIAYTDAAYEYIGVVFTGLPIVTIHADVEIGDEYVPARAAVSGAGSDAIDRAALVHLRGGGFDKGIDKQSYRVEFHGLGSNGQDEKADVSVLGMEADTDWLLISNAGDATCMSNLLSWEMWRMWHENGLAITPLDSRMVEVFVGDAYMGLYQLMPRIRAEEEIAAMGGDRSTDLAMRLIGAYRETGRAIWEDSMAMGGCMELRYAPASMKASKVFEQYEPYVAMSLPEGAEGRLSDEEFTELSLRHVDIEDFMSYYLFLQVCGMPMDNVYNNLYVWALWDGENYVYRLSPWDMDSSFKSIYNVEGMNDFNFLMELPRRMLELNVGDCREIIWRIWEEKRQELLSDDALYQWFLEWEETINATGAYLRESERWRSGADVLNLSEMSAYTIQHMNQIEYTLRETWPIEE